MEDTTQAKGGEQTTEVTTQAGNSADGQQKTFTKEEVDQLVNNSVQKRLTRERKNWETTLEEEKQKAAMTETERLKLEKSEIEEKYKIKEQQLNERALKIEVKAACVELGIVDADAALLLMDKDGLIDDDGSIGDVKKSLEALLTAKPYLKAQSQTVMVPNMPGNPTIRGNSRSGELAKLEAEYQEAVKKGQTAQAISLKNKMFNLQNN